MGAVEIGELADPSEVFGGAVDLDRRLEVTVEVGTLSFDGSDDALLDGCERGPAGRGGSEGEGGKNERDKRAVGGKSGEGARKHGWSEMS